MKKIPYTAKSGKSQFKPACTERSYIAACDRCEGFCLACGATASPVEPDARKYKCEDCGAEKVYGLEELLIMGLLQVTN